MTSPALAFRFDFGVERGEQAGRALARLAEADAFADFQLLRRLDQRLPAAGVEALDQRRFDGGDGGAAHANAVEPRGDDARVVDDQRVARLQQPRQVEHMRVVEPAVRRDDQHPRRVARARRRQRDALGRQIEVEQIDAHRNPFSRSREKVARSAG